jgi:hypothetical protein
MELVPEGDGVFRNGLGELVRLPVGKSVFPLAKGSDLRRPVRAPGEPPRRYVVVPQRRAGADTFSLEREDPLVWEYLCRHRGLLAARRSAVYRGRPEFSVFGVGPYSFSRFKVGISGFHKRPVFSFLEGDPPYMLDDTCYFLPFPDRSDALFALALLNSAPCRDLLGKVAFPDSKRPYTKEALMRIDLGRLASEAGWAYVRGYLEGSGAVGGGDGGSEGPGGPGSGKGSVGREGDGGPGGSGRPPRAGGPDPPGGARGPGDGGYRRGPDEEGFAGFAARMSVSPEPVKEPHGGRAAGR